MMLEIKKENGNSQLGAPQNLRFGHFALKIHRKGERKILHRRQFSLLI